MINFNRLAEEYASAKTLALSEGVPPDEVDNVVRARLQEDASRIIAQWIDQRHWGEVDAVNKHLGM